MQVTCVVIDDENHAREGLIRYVEQIPFLDFIGQFRSVLEFNGEMDRLRPDLIFLDIEMPKLSGVEWLRNQVQVPQVVLTTAYREFAVEGFELDVVDFLVKPISFPRFVKAANKARNMIQAGTSEPTSAWEGPIFIKADEKIVKLSLSEILYFEANSDYVFVHTLKQRYLTLNSLKSIAQEVGPAPFIRIHRSYLVNKEHIRAIEGRQVLVRDRKLPISRQYYQEVYEEVVGDRLW
jgi:DNA-binding LytR/AlgR family response regulator